MRGSSNYMHPQVASLQQHHIHLPITVRNQMRGSPNCMHHQKVHCSSIATGIMANIRPISVPMQNRSSPSYMHHQRVHC